MAPVSGSPRASPRGLALTALSLFALALLPVFGDNENRSHALLLSLYERHETRIDGAPLAMFPTSDVAELDGKHFAFAAPGVAFAGAPGYVPTRLVADRIWPSSSELLGYVAAILTAAVLPAALGVAAFARLADRLTPPRPSEAALFFAFGSMLLPFASRFMAAGLVMGAVAVALEAADRAVRDEHPVRAAALSGAAASIAASADYAASLVPMLLFAVLAAARGPRLVRAGAFALGAAPAALAVAAYHQAAFGSPFRTAYHSSASADMVALLARGWMGYEIPTPASIAAIVFGRHAGLFSHCPAAALGLVGAALACRDPDSSIRRRAVVAIGATLSYLVLTSCRVYEIEHHVAAYTWGPRYASAAVPFALAFLPRALERLPRAARVASIAACVAISWLGVQSATMVTPGTAPLLVDRLAFALHAGPRLGWVFIAAYKTPSMRLVPLVSALLLVAWGAAVALYWRRRDRALAALGGGMGVLTLMHLWWCTI
jgi:hypothetical protein